MVAGDDGGEGMQCGDHPYRSNPGGICAFCLQEKLGKLVNSTKTTTTFYPVLPPTHHSTSPSPPSLRTSAAVAAKTHITATVKNDGSAANMARRSSRLRIPFFYYGSSHGHMKRRKKKSSVGSTTATTKPATARSTTGGSGFVLKRSKSVATRVTTPGFSEGDPTAMVDSPRKRWFWSFLHFSSDSTGDLKHKHQHQQEQEDHQPNKASEITPILKPNSISSSTTTTTREEEPNTPKKDQAVAAVVDEAESPSGSQAPSSFGRKVARSRSVGCGSRSFSGDFLERISTGFGDCAPRRVESQRDPKPKNGEEEMESKRQQRVRCGGIFGGFGMISSSSYWLPVEFSGCAGRISGGGSGGIPHCRGKGWGWAFASPIRAFRPSSSKSSNTTIRLSPPPPPPP